MDYISVVNWEKYQHYKDRNPPWIKVHLKLMENYQFACLHDASKLLLIFIWMLAAKYENRIPADPKWLKRTLGMESDIDLAPLISAGFITMGQDASDALATCKQDASAEQAPCSNSASTPQANRLPSRARARARGETETETEVERETEREILSLGAPDDTPTPTQKKHNSKIDASQTAWIMTLWNQTAHRDLARCRVWSPKLHEAAVKLQGQHGEAFPGLIEEAIQKINRSDHCLGRNDRGWKASINFLLCLTNAKAFENILNGAYDNGGGQGPTGGLKAGNYDENREAEGYVTPDDELVF